MILSHLTSPDIAAIAPRAIAVIPLGATEQHGDHLPVCTDTTLVGEIATRVERALPDDVALLPVLWAGCSHHHFGFPGTVSLSSETYIRVLQDLATSLMVSGFKKIVFLNGHGGNIIPYTEAIYRLSQEPHNGEKPWVVATSYWSLPSSTPDFMESPKLTHACEWETSMMLHLRADWVKQEKAKGYRVERNSKFYDPLGYKRTVITTGETFAEMTPNGAMGNPELATAAKGGALLDVYSNLMIEFLTEFKGWPAKKVATDQP